jgi:hypothetical protein
MKVGHVDVARLRRQAQRIDALAAVMKFVAAPVRQREAGFPVADTGEFGGQIGEVVGDQMNNSSCIPARRSCRQRE